MTTPREVTAEMLTDDEIRAWESEELRRACSTKRRRVVVDTATDAIMTGIDPRDGVALSTQRREARDRICRSINTRAALATAINARKAGGK